MSKNGIPVLRRSGGGGTVLLHPDCIIVGLGIWVKDFYKNDFYFRCINDAIMDSLALIDNKFFDLYQDGISDIAYKEKKIAGTSLFRSRNYLLYQASILFKTDVGTIEKALPHPSREPNYRKNKSHREFLIGLSDLLSLFKKRHYSLYFR